MRKFNTTTEHIHILVVSSICAYIRQQDCIYKVFCSVSPLVMRGPCVCILRVPLPSLYPEAGTHEYRLFRNFSII